MIHTHTKQVHPFDFGFAEKHFPNCPLTPACIVWYVFKYIQSTILFRKWKTWMGCSAERLRVLCFWSVKQEKEATDTDLEPNRIALELSETVQNASGKVIFQKCPSILFPHLAPPPHGHSSFRELMPRLCLQRKQCFPS